MQRGRWESHQTELAAVRYVLDQYQLQYLYTLHLASFRLATRYMVSEHATDLIYILPVIAGTGTTPNRGQGHSTHALPPVPILAIKMRVAKN